MPLGGALWLTQKEFANSTCPAWQPPPPTTTTLVLSFATAHLSFNLHFFLIIIIIKQQRQHFTLTHHSYPDSVVVFPSTERGHVFHPGKNASV